MNLKKIGFSKSARYLVLQLCFVAALVVGGMVSHPRFSCSAEPDTPCDPEYMDALEARAWLEAQREISQNQNLIYKPDSVLEYTCFDYFLNEAASNFPNNRQFSETDRWDGYPEGFSDETTDFALNSVVMEPLLAYLTANFNTVDFNAGAYLNNRTDVEYAPQAAVDGGVPYECAEMQKVWEIARCYNFDAEAEHDGFYDFMWYEDPAHDPRIEDREWELMCVNSDAPYADARNSAFNEDQALFDVTTEILPREGNGAPYLEDDVVTHLDFILPGACALCIPTGICVERPDLGRYQEMVCTNPGCPAPQGGGC